jgi:hypothetical protein
MPVDLVLRVGVKREVEEVAACLAFRRFDLRWLLLDL